VIPGCPLHFVDFARWRIHIRSARAFERTRMAVIRVAHAPHAAIGV
jgi:hypothetical protein